MSGRNDFFENLGAKTPAEQALVAEYEALTRTVLRLAELREQSRLRGLLRRVVLRQQNSTVVNAGSIDDREAINEPHDRM